jgi:hypothetical protein
VNCFKKNNQHASVAMIWNSAVQRGGKGVINLLILFSRKRVVQLKTVLSCDNRTGRDGRNRRFENRSFKQNAQETINPEKHEAARKRIERERNWT